MRYQSVAEPPQRADTRPLTPQPLYSQVRRALLDHIRNGEWLVGDSLPNETFLAQRFGVSIGTIRKAIEGLETSGLVKRIQGRGTYVAGVGSHVLKEKFTRLRAKDGGPLALGYELIALEKKPAPDEVLEAFGMLRGAEIFEVRQRLTVKGAIAGLEVSYLRPEGLPKFKSQMNFGQDLYPLLADYGLLATHAQDTLSVGVADSEVASTLGIPAGDAIMLVERLTYGMDKSLLEYRRSTYRCDAGSYRIDIG